MLNKNGQPLSLLSREKLWQDFLNSPQQLPSQFELTPPSLATPGILSKWNQQLQSLWQKTISNSVNNPYKMDTTMPTFQQMNKKHTLLNNGANGTIFDTNSERHGDFVQGLSDMTTKIGDVIKKQKKALQIAKFNKAGSIAGIAGGIVSTALGDKREYGGRRGDLARGLDTAYDVVTTGVNYIPGVGQGLSGIMTASGALNQVIGKLGGSTDGMTKTDAFLQSKLFNFGGLNPISLINGFGGKRSISLKNQNDRDMAMINSTSSAYAQDEKERQKALSMSNKKYGLFSEGARRRANRFIAGENLDQLSRLQIADDNYLANVRSQSMSSVNSLDYENLINGRLDPVHFGKQGMKILSNYEDHITLGKQGMKILSNYE